MFRNYVLIAWRMLLRQKVFSTINILGLAIGMAACMLILQYMSFELSYDNFHANANNIYRIKDQNYSEGKLVENLATTYSAVGPALKAQFPEVKDITRISTDEGMVIAQQSNGSLQVFNEKNIYYAEPSFLRMFSFPLSEGSFSALNEPNSVVISEKTARKYFGAEDALGKTIKIQNQVSGTDVTATVTGVCKDVPVNSHLQFDFLVSMDLKQGDWVYPDFYTYVLLKPNTDAKVFEEKFSAFLKNNIAQLSDGKNSSFTQGKSNLNNLVLSLQPLRDIHLYSNLSQEISNPGNGKLVWFLGLIAALILLIAYVNYLNLTTAKVIERAKEVGIRKVLGSQRAQLVKQFLFESAMVNILSFAVAVAIVFVCMPWFSKLCSVDMHFTLWADYRFIGGFLLCLVLGILLSALYPAIILSDYKPVQILKGKFLKSGSGISLRKGLVVFQFAATVAFMAGTLIVYQQVSFMKGENKGMDMKQSLVVVAPKNIRATDGDNATYAVKDSVFQSDILRNPQVLGITSSSSIPGESIGYTMGYTSHPQVGTEKTIRLATMEMGSSFLNQFKVKLIAGDKVTINSWRRGRSEKMINEAAVEALGFKTPRDAIGKFIETTNGSGRKFANRIIGVLQNFHQNSLKEAYQPIVFQLSDPNSTTHYELKLSSNNLPQTIAQIEKVYKSVYPASAFEYFFLDDFFNQQYKLEQSFGEVFSLFAGLTIFVACIGLFGLTLVTINQRIKEIGIRKVLGASVPNILSIITRDFVSLIVIADVIALPLAYWGGHVWLQGYAFRIGLSAWLFILPVVAVFVIAVASISYQSVKAALANPVRALRNE